MIVIVQKCLGIAAIAAAAVVAIGGTLAWRAGLVARFVADILVAAGGAGLAAGGLLLQRDVGTASWILTPPLLAALVVAHMRALFTRGGPLRT